MYSSIYPFSILVITFLLMFILCICSFILYTLERTALMWAAERGYIQVVEYLVTKGASIEEKSNSGKMQVCG